MTLRELLLDSKRSSGTRREIAIINPERYEDFFTWLYDAPLRLHIKAFLALGLSGGLRVSEELALLGRDLDLSQGFVKVRVLKKKKQLIRTRVVDGHEETYYLNVNPVDREAKIHPIAAKILREYVAWHTIGLTDKLFRWSRNAALKQVKRVLGPNACVHSLRHSHISWLLHVKKVPSKAVSCIMEVKESTLASYNHIDQKNTLNKIHET